MFITFLATALQTELASIGGQPMAQTRRKGMQNRRAELPKRRGFRPINMPDRTHFTRRRLPRVSLSLFFVRSFNKRSKKINRYRQNGCGVMLAGDFLHGLKKAKL
jgi:hypothetical protein